MADIAHAPKTEKETQTRTPIRVRLNPESNQRAAGLLPTEKHNRRGTAHGVPTCTANTDRVPTAPEIPHRPKRKGASNFLRLECNLR